MAEDQDKQKKPDRREELARKIVEGSSLYGDHTSIDALLEASFGEWPVKGLDIVSRNPQRVLIETPFTPSGTIYAGLKERGTAMDTLGGITLSYPLRGIFVNEGVLRVNRHPMSYTLGHEAIHVLQTEQHRLSGAFIGADKSKFSLHAQENTSNTAVQKATDGQFKKGILRRLFNNKARTGPETQLHNHSIWRQRLDPTVKLDYLKQGIEVQARLHEALILGYSSWDRLPKNRDEFFFAMKSLGFRLPSTITNALDNHPDKTALKKSFPDYEGKKSEKPPYSAIYQIKHMVSKLTKAGRENFWHKAMPLLYGELIEMYGDRLGRERMGLGSNETLPLRQRYEQDIATINTPEWQDISEAQYTSCCRLDRLSGNERGKLTGALNNRGIKTALATDIESKTPLLVVSDLLSWAELKDCLFNADKIIGKPRQHEQRKHDVDLSIPKSASTKPLPKPKTPGR